MVKSYTRLLACMDARSSVEGWHKLLALNFPFNKELKIIPDFNLMNPTQREKYFKLWYNEKSLDYLAKTNFKPILGEDEKTINHIIRAFELRYERFEYIALCKYFKSQPEPFTFINELRNNDEYIDYKRIYKIDMVLNDIDLIRIPEPRLNDKKQITNNDEINEAKKQLEKRKNNIRDLVNSWDVAQWTS